MGRSCFHLVMGPQSLISIIRILEDRVASGLVVIVGHAANAAMEMAL